LTLRFPEPSLADKFLRLIGKKRAVHFSNIQYADQAQIIGQKESFLKAFFRPTSKEIPSGSMNVFFIEDLKE